MLRGRDAGGRGAQGKGCRREVSEKGVQEGRSKGGMPGGWDAGDILGAAMNEEGSGVERQEGAGSKGCLGLRMLSRFSGTGMLRGKMLGRGTQGILVVGMQQRAFEGRCAGEMVGVNAAQKAEMQEGGRGSGEMPRFGIPTEMLRERDALWSGCRRECWRRDG